MRYGREGYDGGVRMERVGMRNSEQAVAVWQAL